MKERKVIKIRIIVLIPILIGIVMATNVMGRFVYNNVKDLYFVSKKFYFRSDVLDTGNPTFTYSNWGGVETYPINFNLYSYQNESLKLNYDLNYTLSCTSNSNKVRCAINSENGGTSLSGTILSTSNIAAISIYVIPLEAITSSDDIQVTITAKAIGEYEKTISATIKLKISSKLSTFYIKDSIGSDYAVTTVTNNNEQYTNVVLEFDPKVVRMDMADEAYIDKISIETEKIDGTDFVKKIKFKMPKESTYDIKFYKLDSSQNYTYPRGNNISIIKNSYE